MGMIPKKTKSEKKIIKGLTVMRFLGVIMVLMLSTMIGNIIGGATKYIFIGFSIVVFFILTAKSPTNPNQSFAKGLCTYISYLFNGKYLVGSSNPEYKKYMESKVVNNEKTKKKFKKGK